MPTGPQIILALKFLVATVTILLLASFVALFRKRPRIHGQINTVFVVLTLSTVIGFEILLQFVDVQTAFTDEARQALRVHLWFAVPSTVLMPIMLITGKTHRRSAHIALGILFGVLWTGTFVTGVFFLPHAGALP